MRHSAGASKATGRRWLLPEPTQLIGRDVAVPSPLPQTPLAQRSSPARYLRQTNVGVIHAGESSGWRCRAHAGPAPPHMPSLRGRHGRLGPRSPRGGALPSAESPGGGGGALSRAGERAVRPPPPPPGGVRAGVETPSSPVEVDPSSSTREPASYSLGWWVHVEIWCSVFCLVTGTRLRRFPASRVAGSPARSPCLVGTQVEERGRPRPAPSRPFSLVYLPLLVVCREGSGRRTCGGRWGDRTDA